ncbi:MAG TPA: substrate-binding domain-containing protein, partial [Acidimicrobiia bacterium]|nr:substrate-binding domain-containing protein [Acidimicrobiia bacterium]
MNSSTAPRVLYVSPMNYGANPAVDSVAHALDHRLSQVGIDLMVAYADFREDEVARRSEDAVAKGLEAGVSGVALWCLDPAPLERPVDMASAAGVPVFTLERTPFDVEAALVFPNFHHGMYMVEYLAGVLPEGARVAVIGGPEISDDDELVAGFIYQFERAGLELLNDPTNDRHRNKTDVAEGGREAALRLLADIPRMDGLIAYNDETMLGTLQALEETGRLGEMTIVSRNGTPIAVDEIRAGRTHGTWDPDAPGIGLGLGELIDRRLLEKEELDGLITVSAVGRMIHPGNADRWVTYKERIPYRELRT